jgi:hypothetical protein
MKTFTKKLIFAFLALFVLFGVSYAQKTVTVGPEGTADYPSIKEAIDSATVDMLPGETLNINIPAGTKVEPVGNLFLNWGKALNIIVSGAGADQTIITRADDEGNPLTAPPTTDAPGIAGRMWQVAREEMDGSTLTFKDMTFKYMGNTLGQSTGSIMNFVNEWDLTVTFENVIFDQCVGRSLFNHNKDRHDFVFDNCLFINCITAPQANNVNNGFQGLIHRGFGGNLTVRNTTFMSNTIINPADENRNNGGLIRVASDREWNSNVVLENVTAVNNKYSNESPALIQPMITFKPDALNDTISVNVTMKDVIFVGNYRDDKDDDVDLIYESPDKITFNTESTGNYFNSVLKLDEEGVYEEAVLPGTNVSLDHTYTSLNMVMDGDLPKLTPDMYGIGKITYAITSVKLKDADPLKIHTHNSFIRVSGLNPGDKLEIYTIMGSIFSIMIANDHEVSFELPRGIYILKTGRRAQKILVH